VHVALAPIFSPPNSEKCLERAEKPTETLASQAAGMHDALSSRSTSLVWPEHLKISGMVDQMA